MEKAKFDLRGWALCNSQQDVAFDEAYVLRMLDEAARCDITYLELIGPYHNQPARCPIDSLITYRKYLLLNQSKSMARRLEDIAAENAKFNRICSRAKALGIQTTVWVHELWFPRDILDFYPQLGDGQGQVVYSSEAFQDFFTSKFEELFETIPDLSGLVLTTCESLAMNIFALPSEADRHFSAYDACVHMINTIAGVCKKYRRDLYVRMFGANDPEHFAALVAAFQHVDPMVRIHQKTCDHGDWQNPFQKANDRHGAFAGRYEIAEEELGQEHFGVGWFPVVYPEVLQHRARNCRARGVRGMVARIDRWHRNYPPLGWGNEDYPNYAWDHEGQMNIVAFNALLQDPDTDLAPVVWNWGQSYYGPGHPYALKALEMGAWIFHDLSFLCPGEDRTRFRRGGWMEPCSLMDDQHGPFGAMKSAGGYRTPKELALVRCDRILQDLHYGERSLAGATDEQKSHYRLLQQKFTRLRDFGLERLAFLDVCQAFANLFFNAYHVVKHGRLFREAVQNYTRQFDPEQENENVQAMITMLQATQKLQGNRFGNYCNAGDV